MQRITERNVKTYRGYTSRAVQFMVLLAVIMTLVLSTVISLAETENGAAEASEGAAATEQQTEQQTGQQTEQQTGQTLLPETGDAVECDSGTLIAPVGDPNAKAPDISAKGAALYSFDMNKIVYSKNENERFEPYSTTKLLTCWLAMEHLEQDTVVTVSEAATQTYENGTTIWLKPGEKITIRDLLYGAMLESGNDAAYALGEAVAGNEADFAELMNKTVESWGCKDTHFVNANGWKDKEHYTTAHDLAIIAAKCLENKDLRDISMTEEYTIPATNMSEARDLVNYFLNVTKKPEQLTGGKTGTWEEDDCSIIASFSEGGLSEVIVLLCDTEKGRPKDVRKLIEFSHTVTPGFAVPAAGSSVETAWVKHGEKTRLELLSDATTYAYPAENKAKEITTEIKYDKLEAPIKEGETVGEFLVYSNDILIAKHKLIAAETVETGWFPSYIYISNKVTLRVLEVIGALVLLILLLRFINKRRAAKRRKKRAAAIEAKAGRTRQASGGAGRNNFGQTSGSTGRSSFGQTSGGPRQPRPVSKEPGSRSSQQGTAQRSAGSEQTSRSSSSKEKREARKRLREKYRSKH